MLNEYALHVLRSCGIPQASPGCAWGASAPDPAGRVPRGARGLVRRHWGTGLLRSYAVPGAWGGREARLVWEAGGEVLPGRWPPSLTEALTSGRSPCEQLPGV